MQTGNESESLEVTSQLTGLEKGLRGMARPSTSKNIQAQLKNT